MEQKKFSKAEWIKLGIGVALIVIGVILIHTIGWLKVYEDFDLGTLILIVGIGCLVWCYLGLVPEREAHVYINEDGSFDTLTPRYYEARKLLPLQGFISRGFKFAIPKTTLKIFSIEDGVVYVRTKSDKEFQCPLNNLIVQYHIENDEISGYTLKTRDGDGKITFYKPGILFEEDEWKDMAGVLSEAAVVKESALAKANKFMSKVKDFDVSDIADSAVDLAIDSAPGIIGKKTAAAATLAEFAKSDEFGDFEDEEEKHKKKGAWHKIKAIFGWIMAAFFVLWLIFNIWVQIEEHNAEMAEDDMEQAIEVSDTEDEYESVSAPTASWSDGDVEYFAGLSEDMDIFVGTFPSENKLFYLSLQPETGMGYYLDPSGTTYEVTVAEENDDRTKFVLNVSGLHITDSESMRFNLKTDWDTISGTFVDNDGQTLSFTGESVEIANQ